MNRRAVKEKDQHLNKIYVVTLPKLSRALDRVVGELDRLGIWTQKLAAVDVYLTTLHPYGLIAYGWTNGGRSGSIEIPVFSIPRLAHALGLNSHVSLADVIRHEYAHGLSNAYRGLIRSWMFREVFGGSYDNDVRSEYDPSCHVSTYAATNASEDFAEVFMIYVRRQGRLAAWHDTPVIRRKWRFVAKVRSAIRRNQSRLR